MGDTTDIVLAGPNLRLYDLRWLVQRCADLHDDSRIEIHPAEPDARLNLAYEHLIVHPLPR